MIKKYLQFIKENKQIIPDTFYLINSAGLYLDVENGRLYNARRPDYKDGFDLPFKDYYSTIEPSLTNDEKEVIDKYYISCEKEVNSKLDMDFFEDIFDYTVSSELLDKYYTLKINVELNSQPRIPILSFYGDSNGKKYEYEKLFKNQLDLIEKSKKSDYIYQVIISNNEVRDKEATDSIKRIESIILDLYPELHIYFFVN